MATAASVQPPVEAMATSAWSAQTSWTVLDTGFGAGQHFLQLWTSWRGHARRPAQLHCVGILSAAQALQLPGQLQAAGATELAQQCYALDAGFHRLLLEGGQVSLTLCVGEVSAMLARQVMQADSVLLTSPEQPWDKWQLKALARCCKRGAQLRFHGTVLPDAGLLADAGFALPDTARDIGIGSNTLEGLHAVYDPHWQPRSGRTLARSSQGDAEGPADRGRCAVIGAGIAGASVARALALRGFQVDVYDTAAQPAAGASGLPVGLVVPHHSADDSPRSRMSRQGTRLMLQHASRLLRQGQDWQAGGVLELSIATPATGWAQAMAYGAAQGLWHPHAAWIQPAQLVQQWLAHPGIAFHGQAEVHTLERGPAQWRLCNAQGLELGRAQRVVLANAHGCAALVQRLADTLAAQAQLGGAGTNGFAWVADVLGKLQALQRLYGTLSHGPCPLPDSHLSDAPPVFPVFPVNGHGSFVSGIPSAQGPRWYAGATFQSEAAQHALLAEEHALNFQKLQALLPAVAQALAPAFAAQQVQAWQGSRCVSHDRLPLVGPLEDAAEPTLWLCAAMGARGLSFSALCAELLVAQMCGEPLPLESNLARSLGTRRPRRLRGKPLGAQAAAQPGPATV